MQPLLTVDLSTRKTGLFTIPAEWEREYLGAASLAARLLYAALTPSLDPLSPEAPLLFLDGPLTGTAGPAVGRFVVAAKSPATGLWGESNIGGFWGPELRKAGFDGLWLTGRAETPVYLWVHDGVAEVRETRILWGLTTSTTQEALAALLNREAGVRHPRIAAIGPAGEAMLPYALILCDHGRVAGRTGMGAVMGSKNLKAIAVKGSGEVPLVDWQAYKPLRTRANRALRADVQTTGFHEMGSAVASDYFDYLGEMPKRYFSTGVFDGTPEISGATVAETILSGVSACHACVIACGRVVRLEDGAPRKGPEYETLVGFGPNLWIDDPAAITRLGELCDRYGLDTISMSNTIGLAFTLYEQGRLTLADTGGLALLWGSASAAEACIHLAVRREGIGAALARGARALAAEFGAPEAAVQVNGLEMPYHDPRGASGMALVYATSPRGACHNQSDYFLVDIGQADEEIGLQFYPRHEGAAKAANVARHQDWRTVCNALVLCIFANVPPETVLELVDAACGLAWTMADLLRSGERAWNLKRAINIRLGLTRACDTLPKTLLQPYAEGGAAGFALDLPGMLAAYYEARGWDPATGIPTPAKLASLGLDWVVRDLWPPR